MGHVVLDDRADMAGPSAHHDDAIGQEDGLLDQVRDHHDAFERERQLASAGPEAIDLAAQAFGGEDIQGAERLIHAEQFRPAGQGAGDADALLHSAGKFLGIRFLETFKADHVDAAGDAIVAGRRVQFQAVQGHADVVAHRQPREQGEILEDQRDARMNSHQRLSVGQNGSAGGLEQVRSWRAGACFSRSRWGRGSPAPRRA